MLVIFQFLLVMYYYLLDRGRINVSWPTSVFIYFCACATLFFALCRHFILRTVIITQITWRGIIFDSYITVSTNQNISYNTTHLKIKKKNNDGKYHFLFSFCSYLNNIFCRDLPYSPISYPAPSSKKPVISPLHSFITEWPHRQWIMQMFGNVFEV